MRIPAYLSDNQVSFESLWHPPAYTASARAKHLRISGREVTKSVLLAFGTDLVVALLPSTMRVDLNTIAHIYDKPARLACEKEVAEIFGDCEWGSMTPFGRLYGLATICDNTIDPQSHIIVAAHHHCFAIRMRCADFDRLEQPKRLDFALAEGSTQSARNCDIR